MADGDVLVDEEIVLNDGSKIDLLAVENDEYPGGVNYRFTYYDPEAGESRLRSDNSQVPRHGVGVHHRHRGDDVEAIEFHALHAHLERFRTEVSDIHD